MDPTTPDFTILATGTLPDPPTDSPAGETARSPSPPSTPPRPESGSASASATASDFDWVAVDKPPGYFVHRSREGERDQRFVLQPLSRQLGRHLYPVHRLDRACSGVLLFATSSSHAARLQTALASPESHKEYLALVRGETPPRFESRRPLSDRDRADRRSREAHTEFETIAHFFGLSLVRARIFTGRRHQIRRHLHHLAHQIVGDSTYGKGRINRWLREEYGLPRLFLHAHRLRFQVDTRTVEVRAPLARDLAEFLGRLPESPEEGSRGSDG